MYRKYLEMIKVTGKRAGCPPPAASAPGGEIVGGRRGQHHREHRSEIESLFNVSQ